MGYYGWRPYVPVAEKRRQAERKLATLKKQHRSVTPVTVEGRTIAKSFWGQSSGLFNALSERDVADSAVRDVFALSEGKPV